jgi:hypothetical protein
MVKVLGGRLRRVSLDFTEAEPQALAWQLRAVVQRSSFALVLIAGAPDVDEVLAALGDGSQHIARQALTTDQVAELEASLSASPPPASPER